MPRCSSSRPVTLAPCSTRPSWPRAIPLADVLFGVDNTYLSRALQEGVFEAYNAPTLDSIPDKLRLDPENRALPIDYGDVCLNYDKAYLAEHDLTPPDSLEDLTAPEYKGLVVVENPSTSSPGLAFLLTTVGVFGDPGYLDFWRDLAANDVLVVDGWDTAYNTEFSGSAGHGTRPIVVSYGSSPVAEVIYASTPVDRAADRGGGRRWHLLQADRIRRHPVRNCQPGSWPRHGSISCSRRTFQEDMPLQMFVFPVNPQAKLDPLFEEFLAEPDRPVTVDAADIETHREEWINAWREVVLR